MTNSEKSSRVKQAGAVARGAIDSAHGATRVLAEDTIRTRAYELYRQREGRNGDATSDWLAAEREHRELLGTRAQPTTEAAGHGRPQ